MKEDLTRSKLEQLSQVQLEDLADEWGIEVPPALNRQILIGEILEAVQADVHPEKRCLSYGNSDGSDPQTIALDEDEPIKDGFSYCNDTSISVVFRNPRWSYILWEIREPQFFEITQKEDFKGFFIKVFCYGIQSEVDGKSEFFIPVGQDDRSWCVYLDEKANSCKVELFYQCGSKKIELASSNEILLPNGLTENLEPTLEQTANPLQLLSGFEELRSLHFALHRQTFQ